MEPQLEIFDTSIELIATALAPNITDTDQQLIDRLQGGNLDRWSAPNIDRRHGTHALFQYPGRMVPEVQQALVQAVKDTQPDIEAVLDPYMGSATSLVASMYQGLHCYGQDINPLAILIGLVKTTWVSIPALRESIHTTVEHAKEDTRSDIDIYFPGITKWFRSDVGNALSKLRRAIHRERDLYFRRFMWLTLAETIRLTSNDRTSTYKLHARPVKESLDRKLDTISLFREQAIRNIEDLLGFHTDLATVGHAANNSYNFSVNIALLDSTRQLLASPDPAGFDLLVTSPPYGDNKTTIPYGQHAFLPLQWIDLKDIDPKVEAAWLLTTNEIDRRSMGGKFHVRTPATIEMLREASPTLRSHLADLASAPTESYRKVAAFYDDFYRSLTLIARGLKPDAYLVWTLGNRRVNKMLIRNDYILCEFLDSLNCEYVTQLQRVIHSKRMPHKNSSGSTMANEQILILRKAGI